jgi:serine/threonine protein kinase
MLIEEDSHCKDLSFRAGKIETGEEFILRFISLDENGGKVDIELIKSEMSIMIELADMSPFFVRFVNYFETNGYFCIVIEYIKEKLQTYIDVGEGLEEKVCLVIFCVVTFVCIWQEIIRFLANVGSGLDKLHRKNIIHGCVKPQNIFIEVLSVYKIGLSFFFLSLF